MQQQAFACTSRLAVAEEDVNFAKDFRRPSPCVVSQCSICSSCWCLL